MWEPGMKGVGASTLFAYCRARVPACALYRALTLQVEHATGSLDSQARVPW
jgi:hypothetical protein